jgi:hypothetical protein
MGFLSLYMGNYILWFDTQGKNDLPSLQTWVKRTTKIALSEPKPRR